MNNIFKNLFKFILALIIFQLYTLNCKNISDGLSDDNSSYSLYGTVQKGPFLSGSSIIIQELDNNLTPTGRSFQTTAEDDFGSFFLENKISSNYVEIIATGYYYNEIAGDLSDGPLTLRSIYEISSENNVNVNILTTIGKDRIKYLVNNEGKSFAEALVQAEQEILAVFLIPSVGVSPFNQMNISNEGESNAILLAVSSILQGWNSVAELSELISKINLDLKEDGVIDIASSHHIEIVFNSMYIDPDEIRMKLIDRYSELGLDVTAPILKII